MTTTDLEQVARAEAERRFAGEWAQPIIVQSYRDTFREGASWLAEYLLSDENVERLAQATFEPDGPGGEYTWAEMVAEDPSRADIWRADARKALQAVLGKDAS